MKVRFLETYKVKAADGPEYQAGEVYDLSEPSAQHFMRKGRAELVLVVEQATTPEVLPLEVGKTIQQSEARFIAKRRKDKK